ncbi:MAG: class I SAM-dependent methyltransferase [Bdellovibrionota bacterium]
MRILNDVVRRVAIQYENFPYPQIPWLALPAVPHAHSMAYEWGQYLRTGRYLEHTAETRILVAGSGAFEPLVAARVHPKAQITAVDLSEKSLRLLRRRARLARVSSKISTVQADLHDDLAGLLGQFDYILCTGVIHHSANQDLFLSRLKDLLKPHGVLRLMSYAFQSRLWIYELQSFFKASGLKPSRGARKQCERLIAWLDRKHPLRTAYETYSDAQTRSGVIDGFFHAHDRPLPLLSLRDLCSENGLSLLGLGHAWHSQPRGFLHFAERAKVTAELLGRFRFLDAWEQLAVIDDIGELAVNPVLWLAREVGPIQTAQPKSVRLNPALKSASKWMRIPAPLMPCQNDELIARARLRDVDFASARFVEGAWLIGNDGSLPEALSAGRVLAARRLISEPLSGERNTNPNGAFTTSAPDFGRWFYEAQSNAPLVPSPVRARAMAGLRAAFQKLGADTLASKVRLVEDFLLILEPRVNMEGEDLPWLSTGDLLRDLYKRGLHSEEVVAVIEHFPAALPQLGRVWPELCVEGATRWFIASELE